ncbi:Shedu immune nuclease family protein [Palleronia sp.]|uniref:Shedu immune nuclease family protein n=1 Tax=Palleronia sp. TaxID=1940284 RepID=UPI0035C86643
MSGADETTFVGGCKTDHLYPRDFKSGAGRFFNYVVEEDGSTTVEYSPPFPSRNRIKLTLTFIRGSNEITAVTLKRFKHYKHDGWVEDRFMSDEPFQLSHFSFEKLASLLQLLKELDLASLNQPRIPVVEGGVSGIDPDFAKKVKSLLIQPDGQRIVEELVSSGLITSHDIVNIGYRKAQLEQFRRMLDNPEEVRAYAERVGVRTDQPEKAWQRFLASNEWIFGFGLDYRFLGILQDEAVVGAADVAGRDAPVADFLLGASHFTVVVEVKQPGTPLFGGSRARSGAWRLSTDLIDSVSQVLQQKAVWQVKAENNAAGNYDRNGALIRHRTTDPKCILIIGGNGAFSGSDAEQEAKLRTFELFRRDSRNMDILTYSELYERAAFVVGRSAQQADK